MVIEEATLAQYSSIRVGGKGLLAKVCDEAEVHEALLYAQKHQLKPYVVGGGTNIFFGEDTSSFLFIQLTEYKHYSFEEKGGDVFVTACAGVMWDDVVKESVARGFWGIENLSYIPGTVGAAPVQNIGAYGAELEDVFESLTAYDMEQMQRVSFSKHECQFAYRNSLFKKFPGRYCIFEVTLKLTSVRSPRLSYAPLTKLDTTSVSLQEVRDCVVAVRKEKLPDYHVHPNCGSFFKNVLITENELKGLIEKFPLVSYFIEGDMAKVPTAWLIEHVAGMKGVVIGDVGTWEKQPLVLVNYGKAQAEDILAVEQCIRGRILAKTGISIEREVNYCGE